MAFCQNCGQQFPDGAPQCPNCGMPMMQQPVYQQNPYPNQQQFAPNMNVQQPKKKGKGCLIAVLVGIGIIILGGIAGSGSGKRAKDEGKVEIESDKEKTSEKTEKSEATQIESSEESSLSDEAKMSYEITDMNFNYYTNSIGTIEYYGFVEIQNTGSTNIYLKDCTFDLEDDNGHLLQSDSFISSCPDIIAPGEKGYFYNGIGGCTIDETVSFDNGIKLVPQYKLESTNSEIIDYDVSDTDMRIDDYGNIKITGRITNNTDEDDSMVYVQFILYDENEKVLAISGTNVMDLTVGATMSFEGSTMFADNSISMDNVKSYTVIARKNFYQF